VSVYVPRGWRSKSADIPDIPRGKAQSSQRNRLANHGIDIVSIQSSYRSWRLSLRYQSFYWVPTSWFQQITQENAASSALETKISSEPFYKTIGTEPAPAIAYGATRHTRQLVVCAEQISYLASRQ
jgi:hypothetical protein